MTPSPALSPMLASSSAIDTVAALRRSLIAEAVDGMLFQGEAVVRFLERGDDAAAEQALARVFDFARIAAAEMKKLRQPSKLRAEPAPGAAQ